MKPKPTTYFIVATLVNLVINSYVYAAGTYTKSTNTIKTSDMSFAKARKLMLSDIDKVFNAAKKYMENNPDKDLSLQSDLSKYGARLSQGTVLLFASMRYDCGAIEIANNKNKLHGVVKYNGDILLYNTINGDKLIVKGNPLKLDACVPNIDFGKAIPGAFATIETEYGYGRKFYLIPKSSEAEESGNDEGDDEGDELSETVTNNLYPLLMQSSPDKYFEFVKMSDADIASVSVRDFGSYSWVIGFTETYTDIQKYDMYQMQEKKQYIVNQLLKAHANYVSEYNKYLNTLFVFTDDVAKMYESNYDPGSQAIKISDIAFSLNPLQHVRLSSYTDPQDTVLRAFTQQGFPLHKPCCGHMADDNMTIGLPLMLARDIFTSQSGDSGQRTAYVKIKYFVKPSGYNWDGVRLTITAVDLVAAIITAPTAKGHKDIYIYDKYPAAYSRHIINETKANVNITTSSELENKINACKNKNTSCIVLSNGDGVTSEYTTIQKAINSASTGDVVYIVNGVFNEKLTIDGKSNLTVTGVNASLELTEDETVVNVNNSNDITLDNLAVRHNIGRSCANNCISISDSNSVTITNNDIHGSGFFGVVVNGNSNDITLTNNLIHNCTIGIGAYVSKGNKIHIINNKLDANKANYEIGSGDYYENNPFRY